MSRIYFKGFFFFLGSDSRGDEELTEQQSKHNRVDVAAAEDAASTSSPKVSALEVRPLQPSPA
jgi:hypothetical protein